MARGKKRKDRGSNPKGPVEDSRDSGIISSARFDEYYKLQGIIPEDEWETFVKTAQSPLPTTFRLAGSRVLAHEINDLIRDVHVPALSKVEVDGQPVEPPKVLPWYPGGLAWQFNLEKRILRKSLECKNFHRFLIYETDNGNISRQEAVSMVPPLFLDVQPHHKVLDMCAAPGSKTAQLLEALHADDLTLGTSMPPGLVVANDSNHKRAQMLVHQLARLPSPSLMVTNLDASIMPNLLDARRRPLHFDRILCDVPCSGDGTTRKNPTIWKAWSPMNGVGLHGLQLRILQRAMKLLDHNGRIVYSTCSLNPLENEAVIAAALTSNPEFELVDVTDHVPKLVRRPGLTSWKPVSTYMEVFEDYEAYVNTPKPTKGKVTLLHETHFPPKDVEPLHLERCMRVYHHLQDTGGFFIAVLQKKEQHRCAGERPSASGEPSLKRALSAEPAVLPEVKRVKLDSTDADVAAQADDEPASEDTKACIDEQATVIGGSAAADVATAAVVIDTNEVSAVPPPAPPAAAAQPAAADSVFRETPYTFLDPDNPGLKESVARLKFGSTFPADRIFVRNPDGALVRALYMCNALVKTLIGANDYQRVRLVHAGVKILEKQDAGGFVSFRILEDGVAPLMPFVDPASIVSANLGALRTLLREYYPPVAKFEEPFRATLEAMELGNTLVRFEAESTPEATLTHSAVLPLWKSGTSVCLMTDKKSKSAMSFRVFGEDITPVGQKLREQADAKQAASRNLQESGPAESVAVDAGELPVVAEPDAGDEGTEPEPEV
ncbi:S-adenosyl-L-methionine-dependent methyltransferase [Auricularia subglabra TFB-10046 SS5]|nr:S-adenosyl-L-methionine-dependent methyltransferase [Auricularia subglabra TFB-10046 SS5]